MEDSDKRKIIIRFPNWLGDCIMATPILSILKTAKPEWEITLMARGVLNQLFKNDPRVNSVIEFNDKESYIGPLKYLPIAERLRSENFNLGLIMPDSFSSALIFYLATIPHRIGYKGDARSFMLTRALPLPKEVIHRSIKYRGMLKILGLDIDDEPLPEIYPGEDDMVKAGELVGDLGNYVVIAPHSNAPSRRWGYEKYARLAEMIHKNLNHKIVFVGAFNENTIIEKVAEKSGVQCLNLAGKTSLLTSFEIMRRASAYVGNDSGGAHLAAASGVHTISLSGADNPEVTRPITKKGTVIRKPLPCSPCVKNICPLHDTPMECMRIISVEEVFQAVKDAIDAK
jgi:heptosyltransferase-2